MSHLALGYRNTTGSYYILVIVFSAIPGMSHLALGYWNTKRSGKIIVISAMPHLAVGLWGYYRFWLHINFHHNPYQLWYVSLSYTLTYTTIPIRYGMSHLATH